MAAYGARVDIQAVVHAHPPVATGFAVAGTTVSHPRLAELTYGVGTVPLVPYAPSGSAALAERTAEFLREHDVVLLADHGAVAVAAELRTAHQRMESLEHAACILLAARTLNARGDQ